MLKDDQMLVILFQSDILDFVVNYVSIFVKSVFSFKVYNYVVNLLISLTGRLH